MGVRIARESDGRVSITVSRESQSQAAVISRVEARLLAIKLLLAAERLGTPNLNE